MIEHYEFGKIIINGVVHSKDVLITSEETKHWWRKEGHTLSMVDLSAALDEKPEVLIIGTGASGCLSIPPELLEEIKSQVEEVIVQQTKEACETYNSLYKDKRVIACLHLTC